jgi:hypothetical protein
MSVDTAGRATGAGGAQAGGGNEPTGEYPSSQVVVGKLSLPSVRHVPSVRREIIAPDEFGAIKPAPGSELPFGFGG